MADDVETEESAFFNRADEEEEDMWEFPSQVNYASSKLGAERRGYAGGEREEEKNEVMKGSV